MGFSEEQLRQLAEIVSQSHIQNDKSCEFCMSTERRAQHRKDHEFIQSFNQTLDKLSGIRWAILRNLLSALVVAGTVTVIVFIWSLVRN